MKTLKRKVCRLIYVCEEHGVNVPSKFFRSANRRGKGKLARIDSATNGAPESSQLIDLPSIDWSQEIVAADVEAAECLRLMGVIATEAAMVGVAECDTVDAGIEAACVDAGTTVDEKIRCLRDIHFLSENQIEECGNKEAEDDGLAEDDREAALSSGYD